MNKEIFLSLGSNYSKSFIWLSIENLLSYFFDHENQKSIIDNFFQKVFEKKAYYFYKAREALIFLLKNILQENDHVATQGFTCYALEKAILDAKMKVVFIDTNKDNCELSLDDLKNKFKQKKFKAIILQRTFGFDTNTSEVYEFCRKNNIIIIEDLAQSFFSLSSDTKEMIGEDADHIILSFGRDKIIDTISGGALLSNENFNEINNLHRSSSVQVLIDSFYPILTFIIRQTHWWYFGSLLSIIFRKIGFLKSPLYTPNSEPTKLHPYYFKLINHSIKNLSAQLKHRRKIAKIYSDILCLDYNEDSNYLRFNFLTSQANRLRIIKELKKNGVYISDYWYKNVVDCSNLSCSSIYEHDCKNAENLTKRIVNLPTHINIDELDAVKIANIVKEII